ncbi:MAG: hypothetical protein WCL30_04200, partial [Pseudomonadota bacterium]
MVLSVLVYREIPLNIRKPADLVLNDILSTLLFYIKQIAAIILLFIKIIAALILKIPGINIIGEILKWFLIAVSFFGIMWTVISIEKPDDRESRLWWIFGLFIPLRNSSMPNIRAILITFIILIL